MKTKDYYNENGWGINKNQSLLKREQIALNYIKNLTLKKAKCLDIGCGNGKFLNYISIEKPDYELFGIDLSEFQVKYAKKLKFNFQTCNIEEGLPFKDDTFEIIYAGELIEHLYNPDFFLNEVKRILKKGGYLILSTPNLCTWYNRILFLFGIQPLFTESSTESAQIGSGFLKRFRDDRPVGHLRVFNKNAIVSILKKSKFEQIKIKGTIFPSLPLIMRFLDYGFAKTPSLASGFVILAKKEN